MTYKRFEVARPQYLSDEHWETIEVETARLARSLDAEDNVQAIGDVKCLVEAVAKVTLEIAGEPAASNASFDGVVAAAHGLLARQKGHELAYDSEFGNMATQASKIARNLGNIRNEFGGGHGRARQPRVETEMVDMALDGGLLWVRWALRRIGLFSEGRPEALIRDLVEVGATFRAGELRRRLELANLADLEEHHQRALGIAVAQRAMQGTFVVSQGGVEPCLETDDLELWTPAYRAGVAIGHLFDPDERPTISGHTVRTALLVLDPLPSSPEVVDDLVNRIMAVRAPRYLIPAAQVPDLVAFLKQRIAVRPAEEGAALQRLIDHLSV